MLTHHLIIQNPIQEDLKIGEIGCLIFYIFRDRKIPQISNTSSALLQRSSEIMEELIKIENEATNGISNPSIFSIKAEYLINAFAHILVAPNGRLNRAGFQTILNLIQSSFVKKIFSEDHKNSLYSSLFSLFVDDAFLMKMNSNTLEIHPTLVWVVKADLKMDPTQEVTLAHVYIAIFRSIFQDLRQIDERNCYSIVSLVYVLHYHPGVLFFRLLKMFQEGFIEIKGFSFPLSALIEDVDFDHKKLSKPQSITEWEGSIPFKTAARAFNLDIDLLQADPHSTLSFEQTLSLPANANENNSAPLISFEQKKDLKRIFSSFEFNYTQRLYIHVICFLESNSLIDSLIPSSYRAQDGKEFKEVRSLFFYCLSCRFKKILNGLGKNKIAKETEDQFFAKWSELFTFSVWHFPVDHRQIMGPSGLEVAVVGSKDENYATVGLKSIYSTPEIYAYFDGYKFQKIYTIDQLKNILYQLAEKAAFALSKDSSETEMLLSNVQTALNSNAFNESLAIIRKSHQDNFGGEQVDLDAFKNESNFVFSQKGGRGIRIIRDYFKFPIQPLLKKENILDEYAYLFALREALHQIHPDFIQFTSYNLLPFPMQHPHHVFTLQSTFFPSFWQLDEQDAVRFVTDRVIDCGKKLLSNVIPEQSARYIVESLLGKPPGSKLLFAYYKKGMTARAFRDKLMKFFPEDHIQLAFHRYFCVIDLNSIPLKSFIDQSCKNKCISSDPFMPLIPLIKNSLVEAFKLTPEITPFTLAAALRDTFLQFSLPSFSRHEWEKLLCDYYQLPLGIEFADLNYRDELAVRKDHVRLGIGFDYIQEKMIFFCRYAKTLEICNAEKTKIFLSKLEIYAPTKMIKTSSSN